MAQATSQCLQVCLQGGGWKVSKVYDYSPRDRSEPRPDKCYKATQATKQPKGCVEVDWDDSCIKSICVKVCRQMSPLFLVNKDMEGFQWTEECEEAFQDLKKFQ